MIHEDIVNNKHNLILIVSISAAVSAVMFVAVSALCFWCNNRGNDDEDDLDTKILNEYDALATSKYSTKGNKHSSSDQVDGDFQLYKSTDCAPKNAAFRFLSFDRGKEGVCNTAATGSGMSFSDVNPPQNVQPTISANQNVNSSLLLKDSNPNLHTITSFPQLDDTFNYDIPQQEIDYNLGKIQFSVIYDFKMTTLRVKIMRAVNLPAKDFSGTSDPYVKVMLLPDKKTKLQTNIKRRNLNPRWNELMEFEGYPHAKLVNRTLYLQVLDYDRFSRDDPIGEVCLPLSNIEFSGTSPLVMWQTLSPCKGSMGKLGEMLVSLCYQPTLGKITLVVMKCKELKSKDINGYSDPYVKIWLTYEGKKIHKQKTEVKERNLSPVFNRSFEFDVPYERIRQTSLIISVMDYDKFGRNELIGQFVLASKSGPSEVKHWNEMFSKSRQAVAQWHMLKDFS